MAEKTCPRCGEGFPCRPDDIARCGCAAVPLSADDRARIAALGWADCLCPACLAELKAQAGDPPPQPSPAPTQPPLPPRGRLG